MSILRETFRLNTGFIIPKIAFGTYQVDGQAMKAAIEVGYRHFDTASLYKNEKVVGEALKTVDRNQIFIASKVDPWKYGHAQARQCCLDSLKGLDIEYFDLMLLLAPGVSKASSNEKVTQKRHDTWKALEELHAEGKIRTLGVSNYLQEDFEKLYSVCSIQPSVNQIEYHPWFHDDELLRYCQDRKLVVEAYSPLAKADVELWKNPTIKEVAEKHGKTIAQVLLRWAYQKNVVVVTKSAKAERIKDNVNIEFVLDQGDMQKIGELNIGQRINWKAK